MNAIAVSVALYCMCVLGCVGDVLYGMGVYCVCVDCVLEISIMYYLVVLVLCWCCVGVMSMVC